MGIVWWMLGVDYCKGVFLVGAMYFFWQEVFWPRLSGGAIVHLQHREASLCCPCTRQAPYKPSHVPEQVHPPDHFLFPPYPPSVLPAVSDARTMVGPTAHRHGTVYCCLCRTLRCLNDVVSCAGNEHLGAPRLLLAIIPRQRQANALVTLVGTMLQHLGGDGASAVVGYRR